MTAKYGSQVVFERLSHVTKALQELNALFYDMAENCRYRAGVKGSMMIDKDKFRDCMCERDNDVCHWGHCTVNEITEDNELTGLQDVSKRIQEQGLG